MVATKNATTFMKNYDFDNLYAFTFQFIRWHPICSEFLTPYREWKEMMSCRWLKVVSVWTPQRSVHWRCMSSWRPAGHISKWHVHHKALAKQTANQFMFYGHLLWLLHVIFMSSRANERPGFNIVEPRLREYYYDIAQWLLTWMLWDYAN